VSFQPSDLGYDELDWWKSQIDQEGRAAVRLSCLEIGIQEMRQFSSDHAQLLTKALGTDKRLRESLLRKAPDKRSLHALLICAHFRLLCACMWIETAGPYARDYLEGRASRNRVQVAASVVGDFLENLPTYWPFDDGTDPLEEDLLGTDGDLPSHVDHADEQGGARSED